MNEELLNTKQAAFYCGVSQSFLANKRVYGGGPYFLKIGNKVSYRKSDLDAWLLRHRHPDIAAARSAGSQDLTLRTDEQDA